jgi:hypothetical protein
MTTATQHRGSLRSLSLSLSLSLSSRLSFLKSRFRRPFFLGLNLSGLKHAREYHSRKAGMSMPASLREILYLALSPFCERISMHAALRL